MRTPTNSREHFRTNRAADALPRDVPAVFRRYRARDGHADWPTLAREADEIVKTVLPTLHTPARGPREWFRRCGSYATAAGNFIHNRRRARARRHDLLPLYFIWTSLRPCNFRCTYCDDHQGSKYPELSGAGKLDTTRARRLLDVMRTRAPSVYFAGGEPTLRKDLPELVRHARDKAFYPIVVNTNGSLFHRVLRKPEWSTFLADVDILVVSLDALDLSTLSRMWVTRTPQDVLRNLLVLRALAERMRVKLMVNCVIQPNAIEHARDVLDFASDLGIWFCPVPQNRGPRIDAGVLEDPEYAAFVREILARKRQGAKITGSLRMNERLLRAEPLECRNTLKPHVDHDGKLIWPCKATVNVKPAYIDVLDFDHVDALYAHANATISATNFHGPAPNQCGADCNWAQNYSTDEYAHGLLHPSRLVRAAAEFLRD